MGFSAPKVLGLGCVCVGVGSVVSGAFNSGNTQKPLAPVAVNSNVSNSTYDNEITHIRDSCKVWEVRKKYLVSEVEEIVGEVKEANKLLNGLSPSEGKFLADIKRACEGELSNFRLGENVHVYIYKYNGGWSYSSSLQGRDWHEHLKLENPYKNK